jgi:hypothetical protein
VSKRRSATPRDDEVHNALLGDLESIRALLEGEHEAAVAEDGDDVPMLEDMVDGALSINEGRLASRTSMGDDGGAGTSRLADETMRTLLGAEWRSSARQIVSDARAAVEDATGEQWSPEQADALNEALKVRIDATLDDWLTDVMYARIDDLRARLLRMLEGEIKQFTDALKDNDDYGK